MKSLKKKATGVVLSESLMERIDNYLNSAIPAMRTKRELFEQSVTDFLDREEIVSAKLEQERFRIMRDTKR